MRLLRTAPAQAGFGIALAIVAVAVAILFVVGVGIARWIAAYTQETKEIRTGSVPGQSLRSLWLTTNGLAFVLADVMAFFFSLLGQFDEIVVNSLKGALVGLAQWVVLRRRFPLRAVWAAGTAAASG